MKQIVVIKESSTILYIEKEYLTIKKPACSDNIIAYRHIKRLYINKLINISISECLKLASLFELCFINQHGNVLGRIEIDEAI
jgi:hypothetical protein